MKNWRRYLLLSAMLVLMSSVDAAYGQSPSQPKSSAASSQNSATNAIDSGRTSPDPTGACKAAADELAASRVLTTALEAETAALRERLAGERRTTQLLIELNETRRGETDAMRAAIDAKNEALAAKDALIAEQSRLIESLRRKRGSIWRRLGDILIGAAAGAVLR